MGILRPKLSQAHCRMPEGLKNAWGTEKRQRNVRISKIGRILSEIDIKFKKKKNSHRWFRLNWLQEKREAIVVLDNSQLTTIFVDFSKTPLRHKLSSS